MAMIIRIVCFQVSSIVVPFVEVGEALASPVVSGFRHLEFVLDLYPCEYRLLALALYSDLDGPPFSVSLEAVVECFVLHFLFPWVVRAASLPPSFLLGSTEDFLFGSFGRLEDVSFRDHYETRGRKFSARASS